MYKSSTDLRLYCLISLLHLRLCKNLENSPSFSSTSLFSNTKTKRRQNAKHQEEKLKTKLHGSFQLLIIECAFFLSSVSLVRRIETYAAHPSFLPFIRTRKKIKKKVLWKKLFSFSFSNHSHKSVSRFHIVWTLISSKNF